MNTKIETVNFRTDAKRMLVSNIKSNGTLYRIMIEQLSEKQYEFFKENDYVDLCNNERIHRDDVYIFGAIDLTNEEDLDVIKNIQVGLDAHDCVIPSKYNKDTHSSISENGICKHSENSNTIKAITYAYNCIGSPDKIIVYKIHKSKLNPIYETRNIREQ